MLHRAVTAVATSPLNCRWIDQDSRRSVEAFDYAVCRRMRDAPRVVNEAECRYCPSWTPPDTGGTAAAGALDGLASRH